MKVFSSFLLSMILLSGCFGFLKKKNVVEKPVAPLTSEQALSMAAEMVRVMFNREDLGSLEGVAREVAVGIKNKASIEGLYRSLLAGTEYRELELENRIASPKTLKVFAQEFVHLQNQTQEKIRLVTGVTNRTPQILDPAKLGSKQLESPTVVPYPEGDAENQKQVVLGFFLDSNFFVLKRVIGELCIRRFRELEKGSESFPQTIAQEFVRLNHYSIPLGHPDRMNMEVSYHFAVASQKAMQEKILWEWLNRINRILNTAERTK